MAAGKNAKYGLADLNREAGRGHFEPVYVITGEEPLLLEEAVDALVKAAIPAGMRDFNLDFYSGDDESARQFLSQARSYPMLAERRAIVVRRFEKLSFTDARHEDALFEYLREPSKTSLVVLVAAKLDRRTRVAMELEKRARFVEVSVLDEATLPQWVRDRFAARGLEASNETCAALVQYAGPGLLDLQNEIEKVALRYAGRKRVGEPEITSTVGRYREEEIWALNREFHPNNMAGFLNALSRVLETEDEPIRVAAMLVWHVKTVLRVKLLKEKGVPNDQMFNKGVRVRGDAWPHLERQAGAFKKKQLVLWLRNLQRADAQMKSVKLPPRWVFERALVNSFLGQDLPET